MAKQQIERTATPDDSAGFMLAERLFVSHWNPRSGFELEHIAKLCLDAAETFERVKRERAGLRVTEAA